MNHEATYLNRRSAITVGTATTLTAKSLLAQDSLQKTAVAPAIRSDVSVLLPRDRVPVSFVIDDSTCLVNMGHFCNPQFATAYPDREEYKQPWQTWPREIPDAFVREFGEWCADNGVKGKYSIVPYPACVGWLDRELPGWTRGQLQDSLKLVRELMAPHWDIHPEMITHTRVIDLKSGRPFAEISKATMENSYPQEKKSVDELAAYLAYALRILKNCDLPCEGITTPGGFGNAVKQALPIAVHQAVRDVFGSELPHYFKYVEMGGQTEPKLEALSGLDSNDPQVTANVPAGTSDWFGGWQGVQTVQRDRYLSLDGQTGRMADLIRGKQPAVMLCHWPGMYNNGTKEGFHAFQSIVRTIRSVYGDQTIWMKLSEIGRYWTAKQLTKIERTENTVKMVSPFATNHFTIEIARTTNQNVQVNLLLKHQSETHRLKQVTDLKALDTNTFIVNDKSIKACFYLNKGDSSLSLAGEQ
ncbi:MAG: hypothetical protein WBD20_25740 [Pirellulaceae bacterium]